MSSDSSNSALTEQPESIYGYIPTTWICIMFMTLFFISTFLHAGQAIKYRMWWLFPTAVLAGVGEVAGWGGRFWSTRDIEGDGFTMQMTATIIAPTPLIAANFILLGHVISIIGAEFSRLPPRLYSRIFLTCDIVALIIQAAGGAMASSADDAAGSDMGGKIMLAGIAFQLVAITAYIAFAVEFFTRVALHKPLQRSVSSDVELAIPLQTEASRGSYAEIQSMKAQLQDSRVITTKVKLMVTALAFSALVLFTRSIYRTVELTDGFHGRIIQTQVYFNVLDGAMIVLAMYTLNFLHPGFLLL